MTVQTSWGWPPVGPVTSLSQSARWFALELGEDSLLVEDFVAAVLRLRRKSEVAVQKELAPMEEAILALRAKLEVDPPPPKLMAAGYTEDLREKTVEALGAMERLAEELGCESPRLLQYFRVVLGQELFVRRFEALGVAAIEELEQPADGSAADAETRMAAAVRLAQVLAVLRPEGAGDALAARAAAHVAFARPLVALLEPPVIEEPDDGWHRPPGFEAVEQVAAPPEEPPSVRTLTPTPPGTPPPEADAVVAMSLHGVDLGDARCRSEILLLEQCADIIARECGIPRMWITNIAFKEAPPREAPPADGAAVRDQGYPPTGVSLSPARP